MGVYDESLIKPLAQVMNNLGVKRAMVVFGKDKLDEISVSAKTAVCEVMDGQFRDYEISPQNFGYPLREKDEIRGGDAMQNAKITREILEGKERGAKREAVCLNAGAALFVANKVPNIAQGVKMAENLIDTGKALAQLKRFIKESNR